MINEEHAGGEPPKEPSGPAAAGERLKRDEWSEGAVDCLLDVYESKWVLRNRAKLKGQDWEEVARLVSSRAGSSSSAKSTPKTSTQCKNKIESMKKRYRSESAAAAATGSGTSRWPLFPRLDGLVRCRMVQPPAADETKLAMACAVPATAARTPQSPEQTNGAAAPQAPPLETQEEDCVGGSTMQPVANVHVDAKSLEEAWRERRKEKRRRRKKKDCCTKEAEPPGGEGDVEVLESIQWLAEVALRMEQARAETTREVEKIRAEAEAKKGEMDLKRTEIIANTQLRIATILARTSVDHLPTAGDR